MVTTRRDSRLDRGVGLGAAPMGPRGLGPSGAEVAESLRNQHDLFRSEFGIRGKHGAVPFFLDRAFELLIEMLETRGVSEVVMPDDQWALIANARGTYRLVEADSIPSGLSRLPREEVKLGLPDDIVAVFTVVRPKIRAEEGRAPFSGLRLALHRSVDHAPVHIPRGTDDGESPIDRALRLAREAPERRRAENLEDAQQLQQCYAYFQARGKTRIADGVADLALRHGYHVSPAIVLVALLLLLTAGVGVAGYLGLKYVVLPHLLELRKNPERQGGAAPEPGSPDAIWRVWPGHDYPRVEARRSADNGHRFRYVDRGLIRFLRRWPDSDIEFTWSVTRNGKEVQRFERAGPEVVWTPADGDVGSGWSMNVGWHDTLRATLTPVVQRDGGLVAIDTRSGHPLSAPAEVILSADGSVRWSKRPDGGVDFYGNATGVVGYLPGRRPRFEVLRDVEDHLSVRFAVCLGPLDFALHELMVEFGDGSAWRSDPAVAFGTTTKYRLPDGREFLVEPVLEPGGLDEWDHYVVYLWHRYRAPGTYTLTATLYDTNGIYRLRPEFLRKEAAEFTLQP